MNQPRLVDVSGPSLHWNEPNWSALRQFRLPLDAHQGNAGLGDWSSWKWLSPRLKECSRGSLEITIHSLAGLAPERVSRGLCKCGVLPEWIWSQSPSCEVLGLGKEDPEDHSTPPFGGHIFLSVARVPAPR